MVFQQPAPDPSREAIPELVPIFTFLNSHTNKLYQEGYFLKLNDLDISKLDIVFHLQRSNPDQMESQISTEIGLSVLHSSLALCLPCGTQLH